MSYLVNDIADYLEDQGLGTVGTTIFVGYQPDSPASCICVFDTGGMKPSIDLPTKSPTFQILIRSSNYATGKDNLDTIRGLLHNKYNETIGGTYYYSINAQSEGGHIGKDDIGNDEFSINFIAYIR